MKQRRWGEVLQELVAAMKGLYLGLSVQLCNYEKAMLTVAICLAKDEYNVALYVDIARDTVPSTIGKPARNGLFVNCLQQLKCRWGCWVGGASAPNQYQSEYIDRLVMCEFCAPSYRVSILLIRRNTVVKDAIEHCKE
ncbi:hypothetical protein GOBAR_AA07497 [Gossypium barbadense]|uniref:Uncharacterized protein n=1 Tax=Gossypium barbadense TaxID=3634 RepID=A0A2P5YC03_GOSBA|nr:hypothetical protein GOBAR_AA07497 [Gossypium barbadense]